MKKHVRILEDAGLLVSEKVGRVRTCRLGRERLAPEVAWMRSYQEMVEDRFNRLERFLERPTRRDLMSTATKPPRKATVTTPSDREIRIERIFNAPRDKVWRAHTDPKLLAQWWGRGNRLVIEKFELERGGHWRFVEHSPDGVHGFEGRFREVTPPERIVQTFEWDGMPGYTVLETLELHDLGDGRTQAVVTSLFFSPEERDGMLQSGMEQGLNQSYAALDRLLETI